PAPVLDQLVVERPPPLVRTEGLGFVFLELRRHVALGPCQRLAPLVFGRDAPGLCVGHLDPVAEDAIEPDAEARNPPARPLALLETGDPLSHPAGIANNPSE